MPRPVHLRRLLLAIGAAATLAVAGCGGDADDGQPAARPDRSSITAAVEDDGRSRFASVVELADALTAAGLPCALEYEGLRDGAKELSLCTLGAEQATLSIWFEPDQLDELRRADLPGGGALVIGGNWTVDVATPELAGRIAEALGGTVKR